MKQSPNFGYKNCWCPAKGLISLSAFRYQREVSKVDSGTAEQQDCQQHQVIEVKQQACQQHQVIVVQQQDSQQHQVIEVQQ